MSKNKQKSALAGAKARIVTLENQLNEVGAANKKLTEAVQSLKDAAHRADKAYSRASEEFSVTLKSAYGVTKSVRSQYEAKFKQLDETNKRYTRVAINIVGAVGVVSSIISFYLGGIL